jgi:hypothetical protein
VSRERYVTALKSYDGTGKVHALREHNLMQREGYWTLCGIPAGRGHMNHVPASLEPVTCTLCKRAGRWEDWE